MVLYSYSVLRRQGGMGNPLALDFDISLIISFSMPLLSSLSRFGASTEAPIFCRPAQLKCHG